MTEQEYKAREFQSRGVKGQNQASCRFQEGLLCNIKNDCNVCGWNPDVMKLRMLKIENG